MDIDLCRIEPSAKSLAYLNGNLKRSVDILGALAGIVFGIPIFLIAGLIVKLVDKVPMLYFQERIGLHGQPFAMIKLRTLVIDEKRVSKPEILYRKPDYVTTRTGRFWRITSVDEIAQFFLVLKGEMSLIGHRPMPLYYLPHLPLLDQMDPAKAEYYLRVIYQYKPGMSSLSSVNGRGDLTLQQKFVYDLMYAREANLPYDLKLILQTLYVVASRQGAK